MSRRKIKNQIKQLKGKLKAADRARNRRLLKVALFMVVLAVIAAFLCGRIQLW